LVMITSGSTASIAARIAASSGSLPHTPSVSSSVLLKPKSGMPSQRTATPLIAAARSVSRTRIAASSGPISRPIAFWPPSP